LWFAISLTLLDTNAVMKEKQAKNNMIEIRDLYLSFWYSEVAVYGAKGYGFRLYETSLD